MRRDRDGISEEMDAKGLTGPRVTEEMINEEIVKEQFHKFPDSTVTVCCLTLRNGFTLVGQSACADPANFDAEMGRRLAYEDAKDKMWALLGFRLRDFLHAQQGKGPQIATVNPSGIVTP